MNVPIAFLPYIPKKSKLLNYVKIQNIAIQLAHCQPLIDGRPKL